MQHFVVIAYDTFIINDAEYNIRFQAVEYHRQCGYRRFFTEAVVNVVII
jgi:hypothetical protein